MQDILNPAAFIPERGSHPIVAPASAAPSPPPRIGKPIKNVPPEPRTLADAGLTEGDVERLVLKTLLFRGTSSGRAVAEHLRAPRPLVVEGLERLRAELLVSIKGSAGLEDYQFQLTEAGMDRANRLAKQSTYAGVAPVRLEDYVRAVEAQSLTKSKLSLDNLRATFRDFRLRPRAVSLRPARQRQNEHFGVGGRGVRRVHLDPPHH
jgi:hypothetical protein